MNPFLDEQPSLYIADVELSIFDKKGRCRKNTITKQPVLLMNGEAPERFKKDLLERLKSKIYIGKKEVVKISRIFNCKFSSKICYEYKF